MTTTQRDALDAYGQQVQEDMTRFGAEALMAEGYTDTAAYACAGTVVARIIGYWINAESGRILERELHQRAEARVGQVRSELRKVTEREFNLADVADAVAALYAEDDPEACLSIVAGRLCRAAIQAGLIDVDRRRT